MRMRREVLDALAPYGITHLDMPLTPPEIWKVIQEAQARSEQVNVREMATVGGYTAFR